MRFAFFRVAFRQVNVPLRPSARVAASDHEEAKASDGNRKSVCHSSILRSKGERHKGAWLMHSQGSLAQIPLPLDYNADPTYGSRLIPAKSVEPVDIDMKPFSQANGAWPDSWRTTSVPIPGTVSFDALEVDIRSVTFGAIVVFLTSNRRCRALSLSQVSWAVAFGREPH